MAQDTFFSKGLMGDFRVGWGDLVGIRLPEH